MARNADRKTFTAPRALLRAGIALTVAGMALGVGGAAASAAPQAGGAPLPLGDVDALAAGKALTGTVGYVTGPLTALQINPLAKTGVDPLDNAVGTQVADFKPLSTAGVTAPLTRGDAARDLPVVGQVVKLLGA
ncbi:hypothetical protein ACIQNU_11715 [Streptomyces sp. NPDC091292]|uniref:hypothetical protein n=1 Tax=Streptomyces sp. NPDC091292 TaxID=3365991 RepID=UPI0037FDBF9E